MCPDWNFNKVVVSKTGWPLVRYPLTFDDEDLEGIEGWISCALLYICPLMPEVFVLRLMVQCGIPMPASRPCVAAVDSVLP